MKKYDLVIFGATGFTGQLITSRLLTNSEIVSNETRILLAGRNESKLKSLLKKSDKSGNELINVRVATVDDPSSLDELTRQSSVLLNCVGPFSKYGEPVVESCLRNGCHYLDITGEPSYINTLIQKYDQEAKAKKVCLVCSCGFDSIPADIGVFMLLKELQKSRSKSGDENGGNRNFVAVNGYLKLNMPGLVSYGTYHTLVTSLDNFSLFGTNQAKKSNNERQNEVVASSSRKKKPPVLKRTIRWEPSVSSYVVPFSTSDPTIVKRSAQVLGYVDDGTVPFDYAHYLQIERWYNVLLFVVVMMTLFLVTRFPGGSNLLLKVWRQPGEGPSEEDRKKSSCELTFQGLAKHNDGAIERITSACVIAGDPGYDETSEMALQSALLMVELFGNRAQSTSSDRMYGVLTTASVFGDKIVQRLHNHSKVRFIVKNRETVSPTLTTTYAQFRKEALRLTHFDKFE